MKEMSYYEKIHKATASEPYLDADMKDLNFTSHFHEEIEIIYVVDGSVTLFVDGNIYTANSGDIGIIMPGEIHSYSSITNRIYIMKIIPVGNGENIDFSLLRLNSSLITNEMNSIYEDTKKIIIEIFKENENKERGYKIAISKSTLDLLLFILRKMNFEIVNAEEKKKIANRLLLLNTVNAYVENNYTNTITLKDISKYCGYSLFYFAHFFKETTNISFIDYLSAYRVEKARHMILISDKKLTDIAYLCGFNNIRSFNRVFKNHFNITPSEYRKKE